MVPIFYSMTWPQIEPQTSRYQGRCKLLGRWSEVWTLALFLLPWQIFMFRVCFVFSPFHVIEMQTSFCTQGISCLRKLCCQWDFLVQLKLSNQIKSAGRDWERAFYPQAITFTASGSQGKYSVYELEAHDAFGGACWFCLPDTSQRRCVCV